MSERIVCPDCRGHFVQPFVCTTCGAQRLYDHTVIEQGKRIDALEALNADLLAALKDCMHRMEMTVSHIPDHHRAAFELDVEAGRAAIAKAESGDG